MMQHVRSSVTGPETEMPQVACRQLEEGRHCTPAAACVPLSSGRPSALALQTPSHRVNDARRHGCSPVGHSSCGAARHALLHKLT